MTFFYGLQILKTYGVMINGYYLIPLLFLLAYVAPAQSKVGGLGRYSIGITTPDSLSKIDFTEENQPLAKGTLTLLCSQIRVFKVAQIQVDSVMVVNLSLFFYNNTLFRISCDYDNALAKAFISRYGTGKIRPTNRLSVCAQGNGKIMQLRGKVWRNGDIWAVALHADGYNADCKVERTARLTIAGQSVSVLNSDCDLQPGDILTEEFDAIMNEL